MLVSYLGNTKNTLFGAILFEADKLLKNLSMGIDNETNMPVTSSVKNFYNELELNFLCQDSSSCPHNWPEKKKKPCISSPKEAWTRMWFVIEDMKLEMPVKETADRNSLYFEKATLKVKAEYMSESKKKGGNPVAECFTKHFTIYFDEFAKEYPVLERLRDLAKISAIAKWLKDSGKPIDLSFLKEYEFVDVPTPETTIGLTASKSQITQYGNGSQTRINKIYGGVDFDFKFQSIKDDGKAYSYSNNAINRKPYDAAVKWDFKLNGDNCLALSIPLTIETGIVNFIEVDFYMVSSNKLKLSLSRYYNSAAPKSTHFGIGWNHFTPYSLFIINPLNNGSPLIITNNTTTKNYKYFFVNNINKYCLVLNENSNNGKSTFSYSPDKTIEKKGEMFLFKSDDGIIFEFDQQCRLISMQENIYAKISFQYTESKLIKIFDTLGNSIQLIYKGTLLTKAICPNNYIIRYIYDDFGDLLIVESGQGYGRKYFYNNYRYLIKITDKNDRVLQRNNVDSLGRLIKHSEIKDIDDNGNLVHKYFDKHNRLIQEKDSHENIILHEYLVDNNLGRSIYKEKGSRTYHIEYDKLERVKKIINPLGQGNEFEYNSSGKVIRYIDSNRNEIRWFYDNENNLITFQDASGVKWNNKYDSENRIRTIIDPLGSKTEFSYDMEGLLKSISTQNGETLLKVDQKKRLIILTDLNGNSTMYHFDKNNNLESITDAMGQNFII
jgi:YD repeat-containing protein